MYSSWLAATLGEYRLSIGLAVAGVLWALFRHRSRPQQATTRSRLIPQVLVRPGSDATWFLPALVWGLQSRTQIIELFRGCPSGGDSAIHGFLKIASWSAGRNALALGITLVLCLIAEEIARRRGRQVRRGGSIPIGVGAVVASVAGVWWMLLYIMANG